MRSHRLWKQAWRKISLKKQRGKKISMQFRMYTLIAMLLIDLTKIRSLNPRRVIQTKNLKWTKTLACLKWLMQVIFLQLLTTKQQRRPLLRIHQPVQIRPSTSTLTYKVNQKFNQHQQHSQQMISSDSELLPQPMIHPQQPVLNHQMIFLMYLQLTRIKQLHNNLLKLQVMPWTTFSQCRQIQIHQLKLHHRRNNSPRTKG